jgi:diaminopimelate decarboxylase
MAFSGMLHRGRPNLSTSADDELEVLRRCSRWRKAFSDAEVAYSATVLRIPGAPQWVRGHRRGVDARGDEELALTVAAGIRPGHVVLHCEDAAPGTVRHAVALGVGQFVVGSDEQIATLAACARRPQPTLVDVTAEPADELITAVLAQHQLDLIRLRGHLDTVGLAEVVGRMISEMERFRHEYGVILTCLSVAVSGGAERPVDPTDVASGIDEALDDACARFRFPRPAPVVSPGWDMLRGQFSLR